MEGEVLRDDQWERLKPFVPGGSKGKRGPRSNNRRFLDATAVDGAVGRTLARPAGRATVKRRYYRWVENGALDRLFEAVSRESDLEWLMIDACVYRKFDSA